jgi:hypothetical protein
MTNKLSAGVYQQEYQKNSGIFDSVNSTIGASVFHSKKGPLDATLITGGYEEFCNTYGYQTPLNATLKPALDQMTTFYGKRVVNGAKYAGLSVFYDSVNKNMFTNPFATGTSDDYQSATRLSELLAFSTFLSTGDTVTLDVNDGTTTTTVTQAFNQTSNNTMALLATQLQATLDNLGVGGYAKVIKTWTLSDRKTEIAVVFEREFVTNDVVNFTLSGTPNIEDTAVNLTYTTGTALEFLESIATALNVNTAISATATESNDLPALVITCISAGPYTLSVEQGETATVNITSTVMREGHGVFDDRTILVVAPEGYDSLTLSATIVSDPVVIPAKQVTVDSNAKIMDIFAENPGAWASDMTEGLGVKFTKLDEGIAQRNRITISQAITVGNKFTCQIGYNGNTWTTAPVTFTTNSDNTLQLIAQAIQSVLDTNIGLGGSATVETVTGGTENDRSILIITPNPSQTIEVTDPLFTGGVTQPIAIAKQIIPNTPSSETFTFSLFNREDLKNPLESWITSLKSQLDSEGNQLDISTVVNTGTYKSANIRVVVYNTDFSKLQELSSVAWLSGGDDGYIPTTSQIIEGWSAFANPEKITVRLLINAGYTNTSIQQAISEIALSRKDCFAILDMPSDKQNTQDAANYRNYELNVNHSYAAIFSPDILVFDNISGTDVYVFPSGFVAGIICSTIKNSAIWFAPAGLNRGVLSGAKGVRVVYDEGDRDILEPLQINLILDKKANGTVLFGEYTLQTAKAPLQEIHTRLLVSNIEINVADYVQYQLFEPNDAYSRAVMVKSIIDFLQPIKDGRGLRDFLVESDITKEAAADIDAGTCLIKVLIKPVSSIKFIMIKNYILGSGVAFDEVEI